MERFSYDEFPYESYPYSQSHTNRIATTARMLNHTTQSVDQARVLEIGCASGGNIIPMAIQFSGSSFVGIDLSGRQLSEGVKIVERLGLKNIELRHMSITEVTPALGTFDYIICHGVYSWVPPDVQGKILEICSENLTTNGVAYISYNTYPGWHMRELVRDIMCYHARQFTDPSVRVRQARNLLDFFAKSHSQGQSIYSQLIRSEVEMLGNKADSYLFHEHLEEFNAPVYFHEFMERAETKGLHFLGEAELHTLVLDNLPGEVRDVLQVLSPDLIHVEQYKDFLLNRTFRQTLLVRKRVQPRYCNRPDQLTAFHVASPAKPKATPNLKSTEADRFETSEGVTLDSQEPLVKAAMLHLSEIWPMTVPFSQLRDTARARLNSGTAPDPKTVADDTESLGRFLLTAYARAGTSLVELHLYPPQFTVEITEKSIACPLARIQAETGSIVTNRRHESVGLEEFNRHLLQHLDGQHDIAALVEKMATLVEKGELVIEREGQPVRDRALIRSIAASTIEEQLPRLARHALLIG